MLAFDMELRHLRYFLAVADTRHFGRAARLLHVTQPTLSQQIKQLEDELGAPLFERRRAGTKLTQAGETFRAYASRALEDVGAGQLAVESLRGLETGLLRVGYPPSLRGLVIPALSSVLGRYPGLQLVAEEALVRRVERRLSEGKLEVGLGYAPTSDIALCAESLFDSRLGLVVSKDHPLATGSSVSAQKLSSEPFALLSSGLRARRRVDAYLAATRLAPRVVLESNSVAAVLAVVRAGLAVTILPEPRFADVERLPTLRLSPAPQSDLAALLWRKDAPRSPAALAFADEIRARV